LLRTARRGIAWLANLVAEQFDAKEQRTLAAALALLGKLFPPRES
jgi:hypothetical protein